MAPISIATIIITMIIIYYVVFHKSNKKTSKSNRKLPPGPKGSIPILGHLHLLGKTPHRDLHKLAKKHGPIMYMRWGLVPTIVISSAESAQLVLKTFDHVFASRPHHEASKYIAYGQRNLIFAKYGPYWRNIRKICTMQLLSTQKVNSMQPMRKYEIALLVDSLKQAASEGSLVDLSSVVSSLNADLSCLMVVGKKYGREGFVRLVQEVVHLSARPNLGDFVPLLGVIDLQGLTRRFKAVAKVFDEFLERIVEEHVRSEGTMKETKDLVDTMLEEIEKSEFEFDRRHVKAIMVDMISASMDTSATTVEWIMTELIRHPYEMRKLQRELEEVVGIERRVEESDLEKLEYLDAVVKEGMRLHPVVPLLHHEAMEDCELEGFFVPKGSRVVVNTLAIHMDPGSWSDPGKFDPGRFVGSNVDVRGRDFELLPFGSGRRSCPGMHLGILVVRLVLAQLLHCFDWALPEGVDPSQLHMGEQFGLAISRAKPLMLVPTYRLHK